MDRHFFESHGVRRLDDESEKAYRAFRTYLQSPPRKRSLRSLEAEGFSWGSLSRWSSVHRWQERARAFDAVMAEEGLAELLSQRKGLVVAALSDSLEDASKLRKKIMRAASKQSRPDALAHLVSSRVEVDSWLAQVLGTVNILGERNGESD